MYADYNYYTDVLKLNKLNENDFNIYAEKASDYMDYITLRRVQQRSDDGRVKKCCCYIAEIMKKHSNGKSITTEKSGNWSASYNNVSKVSELNECTYVYLAPMGLMYRGIG